MAKKIIAFPNTLAMLKDVSVTNEDYVKAVEMVRQYTVAIKNVYQIPALHCGTEIQTAIQNCADLMYGEALKWASIEEMLENSEADIELYVNRVRKLTKDCIIYIDKISEDPGSVEDMCIELAKAANYAYEIQNEIADCKSNLQKFASDSVKNIVEDLNTIEQQLMKGEDVDQSRIEQLNRDIEKLEGEISQLEAAIAGLTIGIGVSATSIILGAVFGGIAGGIVCGVAFGILIAISGTFIGLDAAKITAYNDQIAFDEQQLSIYDQDIVTIQQLEKQFQGFLDNVENVINALDTINEAWGTLAQDSENMVSDIKAAADDLKEEAWEAMKNELNEVVNVCEEFDEHIKVVDVSEATVTVADIKFGMSAEEIEAAVNAAEKIPYTRYMRVI